MTRGIIPFRHCLYLLGFGVFLVLAGMATARAEWVTVAKDGQREIQLDMATVLPAEAGVKVAWGRVLLSPEEAARLGYAAVRALNRFDCQRRTFVTVKRVYLDADGLPLRDEDVRQESPTVVARGSADERLWRAVCQPPSPEELAKLAREMLRSAQSAMENGTSKPTAQVAETTNRQKTESATVPAAAVAGQRSDPATAKQTTMADPSAMPAIPLGVDLADPSLLPPELAAQPVPNLLPPRPGRGEVIGTAVPTPPLPARPDRVLAPSPPSPARTDPAPAPAAAATTPPERRAASETAKPSEQTAQQAQAAAEIREALRAAGLETAPTPQRAATANGSETRSRREPPATRPSAPPSPVGSPREVRKPANDRQADTVAASPAQTTRPAPQSALPQGRPPEVVWSYTGRNGPDRWGALHPDWRMCQTGRQQAPVSLANAVPARFDVPIWDYEVGTVSLSRIPQGVWRLQPLGEAPRLLWQGHVWRLKSATWHQPSQHPGRPNAAAVAGEWVFEHVSGERRLFVAVPVERSPRTAPAMRLVAQAAQRVAAGGAAEELRLDWRELLPVVAELYRYDGSEPWPPCREGATWLVYVRGSEASAEVLTALTAAIPTARPVQPLHGRTVERMRR